MELSREFDKVDAMPIGEDVRPRINDMLTVKYAMLFAEQERK
jgi:hypothetical protein|nr:MAG TPA: hypothetical protein [Caudoviricetes sp.]